MRKGLFITGTDTGVGKTVVSAAMMLAFRDRFEVCYWKPVQTGIEVDDDTAIVRALACCSRSEIFDLGFRLERAVSPHLAALTAGVRVDVKGILKYFERAPADRFLVVEGAGGILVPLNYSELMINVMSELGFPVIVAARSGLGTINHTLMTLELLYAQHLEVLGVVLVGDRNESNRQAIEHFGPTRVIAEIPKFEGDLSKDLKSWVEMTDLDPF